MDGMGQFVCSQGNSSGLKNRSAPLPGTWNRKQRFSQGLSESLIETVPCIGCLNSQGRPPRKILIGTILLNRHRKPIESEETRDSSSRLELHRLLEPRLELQLQPG